jgi:hypothetical protein
VQPQTVLTIRGIRGEFKGWVNGAGSAWLLIRGIADQNWGQMVEVEIIINEPFAQRGKEAGAQRIRGSFLYFMEWQLPECCSLRI